MLALVLMSSAGLAIAASPPAPPAPGSTLVQRTEQRKSEQGTALNDKDRKRLVTACTGAQGKLRLLQSREAAMLDTHDKAHKKIDAQLWIAIGRLMLANQDTFELEKQRLALADKASGFTTTASHYKQVLDDTVVINCQVDPVGFKALLDTTRAYYNHLRIESSDIHEYVVNTVKPTLLTHVSDLQSKSAPGGGNN